MRLELTVSACLCRSECSYHNSTHAADVTQALTYVLATDDLYKSFEPLEVAATITAALIHDVAHPGVSNAFLDAQDVRSCCLQLQMQTCLVR